MGVGIQECSACGMTRAHVRVCVFSVRTDMFMGGWVWIQYFVLRDKRQIYSSIQSTVPWRPSPADEATFAQSEDETYSSEDIMLDWMFCSNAFQL